MEGRLSYPSVPSLWPWKRHAHSIPAQNPYTQPVHAHPYYEKPYYDDIPSALLISPGVRPPATNPAWSPHAARPTYPRSLTPLKTHPYLPTAPPQDPPPYTLLYPHGPPTHTVTPFPLPKRNTEPKNDLYHILNLNRLCTIRDIEQRYSDLTGHAYPLATDQQFQDIHVAARLLHCKATRKLYDGVHGARILSELKQMCQFITKMSAFEYAMRRKEPLAKNSGYADDNDMLDAVQRRHPELFAYGEL